MRNKTDKYLDRCSFPKTTMTCKKGRPCLTNVINLFEEVTMRRDRGEATNIIYLDIEVAFMLVH